MAVGVDGEDSGACGGKMDGETSSDGDFYIPQRMRRLEDVDYRLVLPFGTCM